MREIKFRAWNLTDKCWDIPKTDYSIKIGAKDLFNRDKEIIRFNRGDIALMQFTGLLDKNGKEIYEGDKIKGVRDGNIDYPKVIATVYFDNGAFRENWFSRDLGNYTNQSYGYGNTLEVIGNIYENGELLK